MKIVLASSFDKYYRKRILPNKNLQRRFEMRLNLFVKDPNNQQLKNHRLKGLKKGLYSFSVTGDVRVIYRFKNQGVIELLDIGTHNQVY